ncbi:MAG: hypothetical protein HON92_06345 [Planctomycetaceae bacterium]|nr:hypothetical protein [Planctomycetaceae bacterium]
MDDRYPNIPWLKIFLSGFTVGLKWSAASLLFGIPELIRMLSDIESWHKFAELMWKLPLFLAGFSILFACAGIILIAYYRFYWMRILVITTFILFFAVQILPLIFMPYVGVWGFIFHPLDLPLWGNVIVVGIYAVFLYWWSKIPYGLFIKYNVIRKLAQWTKKLAGETTANRKKLQEILDEGFTASRKKRRKAGKEKRVDKRKQKKRPEPVAS